MTPARRRLIPALFSLTICVTIALAPGPATATTAPVGSPAGHPGAGLIFATVTLRDGTTHTGYLRWRDEDAFWDDTFSARQPDLPWFDYADREALAREQERRYFESHGLLERLAWSLHNRGDDIRISRNFVCLYGDLAALRLTDDAEKPVVAVLKDGREAPVGGPSRDVDADLVIYPQPDQPVDLAWDDLREIRFGAAPATAIPYAARLAGTVEYGGGTLTGNLQWDTSECTSLDTLDSGQEDVPVAKVRRLARNRRGGSDVTLDDGRTLELSGTNDVGDGNRGTVVVVADLGRILVPWNRFIAADLRTVPATMPGYDAFAVPRPLNGTVTTVDGRALTGRLVYDLDEAYTNDLLHGTLDHCDYQIPFALIAAIAPGAAGSCEVRLRDGRRLTLSGDEDTGDGNAGLLVFADGPAAGQAGSSAKPAHLAWSTVREVVFTP